MCSFILINHKRLFVPNMTATTFSEQLALRRLDPSKTNKPEVDCFVSTHHAAKQGNSSNIAYGGCTIGIAMHAACQSVWSDPSLSDFQLYSVLGHFLGPTKTDRLIACEVHKVRTSRSFETRRVVLMQTYDDGSIRECLALTADFMKLERNVEMEFSAPPFVNYGDGKMCLREGPFGVDTRSPKELEDEMLANGQATEAEVKTFQRIFDLGRGFWETRFCKASIVGQNLSGLAKSAVVQQDKDGLDITEKTSLEWSRARGCLETEGENMAAIGFNMDGGLSFAPLVHGGQGAFLQDVGACSTLEFSLRVFRSGDEKIEMHKWHLKERKTVVAAGGITYSEARLWDERGNMVANMTQASIMRSKGEVKKGGKL